MKSLVALSLLLLVAGRGSAQPATAVQVNLDHATFAYDQNASLLELYLGFEAAALAFAQADTAGFAATLPVDLVLRRSSQAALEGTPDEPVWQDSLLLRFDVPDTSRIEPGQQFIHQLRTAVAPGVYELTLVVPADPATGRAPLELRRDIAVPDFALVERVGLSEISLASIIQAAAGPGSPFYKNDLVIQPNVNQLYGKGLSQLFYYAEVYNPGRVAG